MSLALATALWALASPRQEPAIPSGAFASLDSAARALAKAGRVDEARRVVEILAELGYLEALRTRLEAALGMPLAAFEAEWRRWILPRAKGFAQRVDKNPPHAPTAEEKAVLATLNDVRARAFEDVLGEAEDVEIERSLSKGARLHAEYLGQNPDQAGKWPGAHEEYADHEGFTPQGAIAGTHSVIAFGVERPEDAIDDWMDTFYHRFPLLEPGLLRVGFGWESDVAVMDVQSLWEPPDGIWEIVWPHDGMEEVPLSFGPELPSPIPGIDTTTFGYPITLQVGLPKDGQPPIVVEMKLLLDDAEVPCHYSTPDRPTNVELAPRDAFCLIPKAALKPGRLYTVVAEWKDGSGKRLAWSFKT